MDYGTDASTSYLSDMITALRTYFKYKNTISQVYYKDYASEAAFMQVLKNEIQHYRPSVIAIYTSTEDHSGHFAVIDGYQENPTPMIHFNLGWAGSYDAWHYGTGVSTDDGIYNYGPYECALIGIEPPDNPVPVISSISPASYANAGQTEIVITVHGSNFATNAKVRWNGIDVFTRYMGSTSPPTLEAHIYGSDTDIITTAVVPVTVFNPRPAGGISASSVNFTINNPVPAISDLSPSSTHTGGSNFNLIVYGSNFVSGSQVQWNGENRTTTFVSKTQLTTVILASDRKTATTANVTVVNPAPGGGTSPAFAFSISTAPSGGDSGGGGCFIATAAFGSPLMKQVEILRQFRDKYLLTNVWGKKFVSWYYSNGPVAANYIKDKPLAKVAVQAALYPFIGFSFLLIYGYMPFVIIGFLLSMLIYLRLRPKKFDAM